MIEIPNQYIRNLFKVLFTFLIIVSLFFVVKLLNELRTFELMGGSSSNIITLSGHGEVSAVPDIANVYFTITKEAPTVKEAQESVASVEAKVLEFLKTSNVDEKDVQTANASFYPRYKYTQSILPCNEFGCPPRPTQNVIAGYEASEGITVKVRNIDDVGKIMQGLGAAGVSDLSGPNFTVEKEDDLKAEARKEAIEDAQKKAEVLAEDLGVRLGRISNFTDQGGYYPMSFQAKDVSMSAGNSALPAPAAIPKGQTTISSDISITYEIR